MSDKELFPITSEQPESKDIKRALFPYLRFWYLFLIGAALSIGIAYIYLHYYAVPQYSVYSTLLIKDDKSGQGMSSADALNDLGAFKTTKNVINEIEVLKSKGLMTRVVSELNLLVSYYVEGKVKEREIYANDLPIQVLVDNLSSEVSDKSFVIYLNHDNSFKLDDHSGKILTYNFGQQITKPYGNFTVLATAIKNSNNKIIVRFQDIQQVAGYYSKAIVIQQVNKEASVLSLTLIDPLPEKAKNIINKLMEVYNREAVEDKNLMATNTLKFLDERLQYLTKDLSGVEKVVENYKSANGLVDINTQAANYTEQASDYNKQLSEWAIQIDVLESIENYLKNTGDRYSTVPSTLGIKDETLLGLLGKFNELQMERERMLRTVQPGSELIQNINEQLANLRINILENLQNIKKGLQITSNSLKASSGQFQSKIRKVPVMERELLQINRQQAIKQSIYSYLLQKREETALTLAATASIARIIDRATGGDYPISPNEQTIYLIALLIGLGIPFAGIYTSLLLNNEVQTKQDVTSITTIPIIGEIAHNNKDTVVVAKGNRSQLAEMFRLVRANLNFAAIGKQNIVLLVTSSMGGEGKTFCSINLGASLAIAGKRVVLLDLDLRKPKVAVELELPDGPGITNYLISNQVSISDIVRHSEKVPDLFVISSGPVPPNPAELMMSARFAHLMAELKESFDYIIIDTSPIGLVADAFTLSYFADFSIYIVRYNYTSKAQLKLVNDMYINKKLRQPMILLNDTKKKNSDNHSYGYGYGEDVSEKNKKNIAI